MTAAIYEGICGGWPTILMNRINPALFVDAFTAWMRQTSPDKPDFVATSRRSHDRSADKAPLHLVSAFAATSRLVPGQGAVPDKSGETTALAAHLERLGANDGLKGAIVSIDAIATNATIATAIRNVGADYLLAINANQPTLCAEVEACFADAPAAELDRVTDIEERRVTVSCEADWLAGSRRFPDELRLPEAKTIIRVKNRTELKDRCRHDQIIHVFSTARRRAGRLGRAWWSLADRERPALDPRRRLQRRSIAAPKGHGAHNSAVVRHFALNLVRALSDKRSIKRRRKVAGWNADYLASIIGELAR